MHTSKNGKCICYYLFVCNYLFQLLNQGANRLVCIHHLLLIDTTINQIAEIVLMTLALPQPPEVITVGSGV